MTRGRTELKEFPRSNDSTLKQTNQPTPVDDDYDRDDDDEDSNDHNHNHYHDDKQLVLEL